MVGKWEESEESESSSESLSGEDISIGVRICERVGSEGEEGIRSRHYRA
jgi:hypothetical protein